MLLARKPDTEEIITKRKRNVRIIEQSRKPYAHIYIRKMQLTEKVWLTPGSLPVYSFNLNQLFISFFL